MKVTLVANTYCPAYRRSRLMHCCLTRDELHSAGHAADSKQRPGRSQQASAAQLNPLQSFLQDPFRSFFGDQEFSNLTPMTQPGHGSMLFHTSSSFAEHGPDGLQYSQSQSSTFGPQRVSLLVTATKAQSASGLIDGPSVPYLQVTEHQKRVQDTRTGQDEMTISRHLRDKVDC